MEKLPSEHESSKNYIQRAEEYLVTSQGVSKHLIEKLHAEGFRYTTMICPDISEQMTYEVQLKKQYSLEDIKIIPLSGGGASLLG